jgi:hypothetical protein
VAWLNRTLRFIGGIGAAEFMVAEVVHPEGLEVVRPEAPEEALLVVAEVAVHPAVAELLLL